MHIEAIQNKFEDKYTVTVQNPKQEPKEPLDEALIDAGLTQAEYERVVKGVKLSDPVDAEISRSCTADITSLSFDPITNTLYYGCIGKHTHAVGPNNNETVLVQHKGTLLSHRPSVQHGARTERRRRGGVYRPVAGGHSREVVAGRKDPRRLVESVPVPGVLPVGRGTGRVELLATVSSGRPPSVLQSTGRRQRW